MGNMFTHPLFTKRPAKTPEPRGTFDRPLIFKGISGNSQWADEAARAGLRRAMANGKGYSRNEGY